jgi:hypothetical protein
MLDTVFASIRSQCKAWEKEAAHRRAISSSDPVADTLIWCASELEEAIRLLENDSEWLTPEEYGAQYKPEISGQTVRNWIHRGELKAEHTAKGYRIARRTQRVRRAA